MLMLGLAFPSFHLRAGNLVGNEIDATNELSQDQRIVKGVVTDDSGLPLPGVAVKIKGQHTGTATDDSGYYQLMIDDNPDVVLEFSFIGMKQQDIRVGDRTEISVQMEAMENQLDEVMVVAYGTAKREAFTGSAVSIKSDKLTQAAASRTSAVQALQGNVAGVRFSSTNGQPGDLSDIQIRGVGSLNQSTAPLYVIDGVTISAGLNMLNPEDIESMTVLKDAAATSLYGNRASNGVIIITTKKGREGKMRFSATYEHAWSMQTMPRSLKGFFMNTRELTEYAMEALQNRYLYDNDALPWQSAYDPGNTAIREDARNWALRNLHSVTKLLHPDDPLDGSYDYGSNSNLEKYLTNPRENNWEDALFHTGEENKLNLSVTGGNENLNLYGSLGYVDQKGIVIGSEYERFTGRISVSGKLGRYIDFSLGENIGYSTKDEQTMGGGNYYYSNPIYGMYSMNLSQPIYLPDGSLNPHPGYWNSIPNYVANLNLISYTEKEVSSISNLALTVNFTDWLNFKTVNGIDLNYVQDKQIWKPESNDGAPTNGHMWQYASLYYKMTTANTLNFSKVFGAHSLGALVGYEATHKGCKVKVDTANDDNAVAARAATASNDADIIVTTQGLYQLERGGNLVDLTDVYDSVQEGYTVPLKERMNQTYRDYFETSDNKFYQMPWIDAYAGFLYNKTSLDKALGEGNYKLPNTTHEFEALCQKLKEKGLEPISMSTAEFYYNIVEFTWMAQYMGGLEAYNNMLRGYYLSDSGEYVPCTSAPTLSAWRARRTEVSVANVPTCAATKAPPAASKTASSDFLRSSSLSEKHSAEEPHT